MIGDTATSAALAELLAWYREMGIDAALSEEPVDWLDHGERAPGAGFELMTAASDPGPAAASRPAPSAAPSLRPPERAPGTSSAGGFQAPLPGRAEPRPPPAATRAAPLAPPPRAFPTAAPDEAVMAARATAKAASSLEDLRARLEGFDGCGLKATAKNLCFYRGAATTPLMIIGEAPGRDEDLEGRPFVGRAGQLLDKMLAAIGLTEADVHITNIVYWRPPGNRTPTPQEALVCRPFLERQIELVAPRFILTLGGPATKEILGVGEGIMRLRGKWRDFPASSATIRVMPTLHPAYLLRSPAAKRMTWRDLLALKAALEAKS